MNLARYLARRLALTVGVLFGVLVVTFVVAHVIPADPVGAILGGNAPPEKVAELRHQLNLDKPLWQQFTTYLGGALRGDLGRSLRTGRPVLEDIQRFFPATLELALAATGVAVFLGIPLGVVAAVKRDRLPDHVARVVSVAGASLPVFWVGLLLLLVFYYRLGWLPGGGRLELFTEEPPRRTGLLLVDSLAAGRWDAFADAARHLVLPALVLGLSAMALLARTARASMLEVLAREYLRAARARGLPERAVLYKHALRNALIPTLTLTGLVFGGLLEGAVLTETVFAWPGLGRYITTAYLDLDYPAVMGGTLYIALVYSLASLLVDITVYALFPSTRPAASSDGS